MMDYHFRHFTPLEDETVLEGLRTAAAETGLPSQTPLPLSLQLSMAWSQPRRVENAWVIEKEGIEGQVCGYFSLFRQSRKHGLLTCLLHPEVDPAVVRHRLMEAVQQKARDLKMHQIFTFAEKNRENMPAFLAGSGFEFQNQAFILQAPEGISIADPVFPEGYFLRTYSELKHLPTLAALLNRAYYVRSGYLTSEDLPITIEFLQEHFQKYPDYFPPEGMFILLNSFGKAVAYIRAFGEDAINSPGIVPEERQYGLHLALLQVALAHLRAKGPKKYQLFLNEGQQYLFDDYRSIGFSVKKEFDVYAIAVD